MKKNEVIGIIIATRIEAAPFIKGMGLERIEKRPVNLYKGDNIFLALSGIGKSNAAIASTYLICKYQPSKLFNLGAAGAVKQSFRVGEILHIKKIVEYDRPSLLGKSLVSVKPDIIAGFSTAILATQDRAVIKPSARMKVSGVADLVDMEGAAFVQACRLFSKEAYLFKVVTDTSEHSSKDIIINIMKTRNSLFNFFKERILPGI